jgi:phosphate-selective porin
MDNRREVAYKTSSSAFSGGTTMALATISGRRFGVLWPLLALLASTAAAEAPPEPGPVPPAADTNGASNDKVHIEWKDGRTTLKMENAEISLSNRVQFRLTDQIPDDSVQLPGTVAPGDAKPSFRVRRAKTNLTGWFWRKELTFDLQLAWAGPDPGASAGSPLEDLQITYDVSGKGTLRVSAGQFKVPFGRQEQTSSGRLQFCDRDLLSEEFTRGRDVGVQVDGAWARGHIEYGLGAFNGNSRNRVDNDNAKFQYDGHVTFQPWGDVRYSEGDFESKDKPLAAFGVELENNNLHGATNVNDFDTTIWGGFAILKYRGASFFGEYFARSRQPEAGPSFGSNGWHVQGGYFIRRDTLEVALRYATWDPTDTAATNDQSEVGGAVSYYVKKHNLKFQADYRSIEDKTAGTKSKELRVQTQVVF